ncbi:hypothetical protein PcaKH16_29400 [Parageobacillus caldoxylosilyticus]|jgi:hypothetical protein|uniref:Uncharacterized protein n=1 Tax=Parageobacillus caldoxylosilyticus NBRC 107762 TaxID=1220594 RepID=A0A023DBF2_9BACL|nr:hypothetical protein PcaKH16_29400 [Parageobacillus caldoxylosilyticus]BDG44551.1 hypothetical protein PcaKH35_28960 [Parageobacillus caldoxylosilyticus]GAJ38291.1 hypothetical protein GCA01S_002_00790 [Parageobacillus caldoxylosilyticus NBRC 107762]
MSSDDECGKGSVAEVGKVSLLFPLVLRLRNVGLSRCYSSWRAISLCEANSLVSVFVMHSNEISLIAFFIL